MLRTEPQSGVGTAEDRGTQLYLDLLKRSLVGMLSGHELQTVVPSVEWKRRAVRLASRLLARRGIELVRAMPYDLDKREQGLDWPLHAVSMIGLRRMDNLEHLIRDVLRRGVPGDLIETGVWRGGATILMRAVLKAHGDTERSVWVADSFQGLPRPDAETYPVDAGDPHHTFDNLVVSLEEVRRNFERYGLLDEQVRFLPGWFRDTLPEAPISKLAVLRLDGDMYESTMVALRALYPRVSPGGWVIVDDYALKGCRAAVHDFLDEIGMHPADLQTVDWTGVYWQRSV
ncbi:MAG TPA: TylF/MycF family methyltransferase [Candidatus Dormibacteraeota bacterium]